MTLIYLYNLHPIAHPLMSLIQHPFFNLFFYLILLKYKKMTNKSPSSRSPIFEPSPFVKPETKNSPDHTLEIFNLHDTSLQSDPPNKLSDIVIEDLNIEIKDNKTFQTMPKRKKKMGIDLKIVRQQFIRKTLAILAMQFFFSMLLVIITMKVQVYRKFVVSNIFFFLGVCLLELGLWIILACFKKMVKTVPINYLLLFLFTACMSYVLGFICAIVSETTVLLITIITVVVVVLLIFFTVCSPRDITIKIGLFLYLPAAAIFIIIFAGGFPDLIGHLFISLVIVIVFLIYLIYDLGRLAGKFEDQYTVDDYIIAALNIYVDVVFLFKESLILATSFIR